MPRTQTRKPQAAKRPHSNDAERRANTAKKKAGAATKQPAHMAVTSDAFGDGEEIPTRYTGHGEDVSPPLSWSQSPPGTQSFVLLCDDPDASTKRPFHHWMVWRIPGNQREVAEGLSSELSSAGLRQGKNDFGEDGYRGPKPPAGEEHHYVFRVLALDLVPDLPSGANRAALDSAITGHVIGEGSIKAIYRSLA